MNRINWRRWLLLAGTAGLLLAGCTTQRRAHFRERYRVHPREPYRHTRQDATALAACFRGETELHEEEGVLGPALGYTFAPMFCLVSLSVSAVVETVRLPIDLWRGRSADIDVDREWEKWEERSRRR